MTVEDGAKFGGILAIVGLAVGYVQSLVTWVSSIAVRRVWLSGFVLYAVSDYLAAHGRRMGGHRSYSADKLYNHIRGRGELAPYEETHRAFGIWMIEWRPLRLSKPDKPLIMHEVEFQLSCIRGTLDIETLIVKACEWSGEFAAHDMRRHKVVYHHGVALTSAMQNSNEICKSMHTRSDNAGRRYIAHKPTDFFAKEHRVGLDSLIQMPEQRALSDEILRWFADREWYESHDIPWRCGYLYTGDPGTGKTSHVRAIAEELDMPIHSFDLATMNNEDLRRAWESMAADAPCVALIEDIDRVFNLDKNISPVGGLDNGKLTFDALLNSIDGVERHGGVLLVITTNNIDKVDPALKRRRGRVDSVVKFEPLDRACRVQMATRILGDAAKAEKIADIGGAEPAAAFSWRCVTAARDARLNESSPYR